LTAIYAGIKLKHKEAKVLKKNFPLTLVLTLVLLSILAGCSSTTITEIVTTTQTKTVIENQVQTTTITPQTITLAPSPSTTTITVPPVTTFITQTMTITPPTITETQTVTMESLLEHNTDYKVIRDIEYCQAGDRNLVLDIYIPDEPIISPAPAVVWIHGGGWRTGGKSLGRDDILMLVEHGFTLVSIEYRLSSEAVFPAAVEDSKCAVRWLRAHAEQYNIDPERIGVWGSSAGGHLSLMVACVDESTGMEGSGGWSNFSSQVQAACSSWGVSNMVIAAEPFEQDNDHLSAIVQFLGGLPSEIPEVYEIASPVTHASQDDPPILLVHGDMDALVSFRQSQIMYQAYLELGLEADLLVVNGAGHGLKQMTDNPIFPSQEEVDQIVLEFFVEHLVINISNN